MTELKSTALNGRKTLSIAIAAVLLGGCGGGGSSNGGGTSTTVGGIDGSGDSSGPIASGGFVVSGPINGFGSVIVNGVAYETGGTEIYVDGELTDESSLQVGQLVQISASSQGDDYRAERIVYDKDLSGPIQEIDLEAERLVVLGQTVLINSRTTFDRDIPMRSLEGLSAGNPVEVSGYMNADQDLVATRIELEDDDEDFEVTGMVTDLDSEAMSFMIRDQVVDYSTAELDDFDGRSVTEGDRVEVEGGALGAGGELMADSIELKKSFFDDNLDDGLDDREVEISGLITRFGSATDFDVSGVPVTTTGETGYDDGVSGNLALNVLVEVEGRFNSDDVLVAEEIEFEDEGELELEGSVDGVDTANGLITMLGTEIRITDATRMDDDDIRRFSIDDIGIGDWLEVKGYEEAPGSNLLIAISVERDDDDNDERKMKGVVTDLNDPTFRILDLDIDTSPSTEFDDISRASFFADAEGRLVEVEGSYVGGRFLATEVELLDEENNNDNDDDDDDRDDDGIDEDDDSDSSDDAEDDSDDDSEDDDENGDEDDSDEEEDEDDDDGEDD